MSLDPLGLGCYEAAKRGDYVGLELPKLGVAGSNPVRRSNMDVVATKWIHLTAPGLNPQKLRGNAGAGANRLRRFSFSAPRPSSQRQLLQLPSLETGVEVRVRGRELYAAGGSLV